MARMVNDAIDVLVVGAGMYVCGKGTDGFGTILPALFEAHRQGLVNRIHIAATSSSSAGQALAKATALARLMNLTPPVHVYPSPSSLPSPPAGDSSQPPLQSDSVQSPLPSDGDGGGQGGGVVPVPTDADRDPVAYRQALSGAPSIRAAIVSVPDEQHFAIAHELVDRGLHTLVVKPLVATVAEARQLVSLAEAREVYGAVEYHKRFDEANLKLLDLIRQGRLGRLLNFSINFSQRKVIPTKTFRSWVGHTDIFQYLGVHYVDLIHFLTKARPRRLMAVGMKKYLTAHGIDTWDTIQTLIEWQDPDGDDFLSSHLSGWIDPDATSAMSDQRLEVIGTKGRYQSDQKNRGVNLVTDEGGVEAINPYFSQLYPSLDGEGMTAAGYGIRSVIQFVDDAGAIIAGRKKAADLAGLRATFASSMIVAAVLEANRQSLAFDNQWVQIP